MTVPAPGWYPDPHQAGTLRWFDGHGWTDHVAPLPGADPYASAPPAALATPRADATSRRLSDRALALIVLGGLAGVVLVGALGVTVAQRLADAWDRAVVAAPAPPADTSGGGAPGGGAAGDAPPAATQGVTCDDVRAYLVEHPEDYWEQPELQPLTITNPEVIQDRQATTDLPAAGEAAVWVLDCRFDATFNAGRTADVWATVLLYPDGGLEVQID